MKKILLALIFLSNALFAQQTFEGEVELAGFVLGQYRKIVHAQLGAPIERRVTDEGWIYEFHKLKPDTSVYALFKYPKWDTTRIYSIQLNGDRYDEMKPFRGLKLGATKDMVHKTFGPSSRTEMVEDPPLVIEYYDNHNYSFDINKETGALFGIQIYGRILEQKPQVPSPSLAPFKNAVLTKNEDSIIATVAPDVEFYKDGKVIRYKMGVRKEFSDTSSDLVKHILGDNESLLYVFATEKAADVPEQRIYNKRNDVTTVYKFPSSKVLDEIVFIPHAGQWKVYEVRFR